jgi:hypothetical protein
MLKYHPRESRMASDTRGDVRWPITGRLIRLGARFEDFPLPGFPKLPTKAGIERTALPADPRLQVAAIQVLYAVMVGTVIVLDIFLALLRIGGNRLVVNGIAIVLQFVILGVVLQTIRGFGVYLVGRRRLMGSWRPRTLVARMLAYPSDFDLALQAALVLLIGLAHLPK